MGLQNFLVHVLQNAGRPIDLTKYSSAASSNHSDGTSASMDMDDKQTLRIALDVSMFIYKACQFHGDKLADERHLHNLGRSQLLYEQRLQQQQQQQLQDSINNKKQQKLQDFINLCCHDVTERIQSMQTYAEILVVLDGRTPPIKSKTTTQRRQNRAQEEAERDRAFDIEQEKQRQQQKQQEEDDSELQRRLKANRRAGAGTAHYGDVLEAIIHSLRQNRIPFLVAPYEADGQLAFLQQRGLVDLIVTEDSDLVAYKCASAVPILYKLSTSALVAPEMSAANAATMSSALSQGILVCRDDLNGAARSMFDPGAPKLNFADFSPAMMACVFAASGCDYCSSLKGIGNVTAIELVRMAFLGSDENDQNTPLGRLISMLLERTWSKKELSDQDKRDFEQSFLAAIFMFRHNLVYNPITGKCRSLRIQPDAELVSYGPYRDICNDPAKRRAIVGDSIPSPLVTYVAEGWLCPRSLRPRKSISSSNNNNGESSNVPLIPEHVLAALRDHHGNNDGENGDDDNDNDAAEPESQATTTTPLRPISVRDARQSLTGEGGADAAAASGLRSEPGPDDAVTTRSATEREATTALDERSDESGDNDDDGEDAEMTMESQKDSAGDAEIADHHDRSDAANANANAKDDEEDNVMVDHSGAWGKNGDVEDGVMLDNPETANEKDDEDGKDDSNDPETQQEKGDGGAASLNAIAAVALGLDFSSPQPDSDTASPSQRDASQPLEKESDDMDVEPETETQQDVDILNKSPDAVGTHPDSDSAVDSKKHAVSSLENSSVAKQPATPPERAATPAQQSQQEDERKNEQKQQNKPVKTETLKSTPSGPENLFELGSTDEDDMDMNMNDDDFVESVDI